MPVLICLALALGLAVAGCGSKSNDTAGGASQSTSTSQSINQNDGGATAGGTTVGHSSGVEPPPIQVLLGGQTGVHVNTPTVKIVRTQKDFKTLLAEHFSHGVPRTDVAGTTWGERQIVGVFFPKSPKGTEIGITAVNEINGQVVVKVGVLEPGKGCHQSGPKPRPFSMVDTRDMKTTKAPKLVIVKQPATPC